MAADADESARQRAFGGLREVDDLRHIGEVVAGKSDEIRLPFGEHAVVIGVSLDLQIHEPDGVLGAPGRLRHELEAQRLEPKEDIRVEEWARMNEQSLHGNPEGRQSQPKRRRNSHAPRPVGQGRRSRFLAGLDRVDQGHASEDRDVSWRPADDQSFR